MAGTTALGVCSLEQRHEAATDARSAAAHGNKHGTGSPPTAPEAEAPVATYAWVRPERPRGSERDLQVRRSPRHTAQRAAAHVPSPLQQTLPHDRQWPPDGQGAHSRHAPEDGGAPAAAFPGPLATPGERGTAQRLGPHLLQPPAAPQDTLPDANGGSPTQPWAAAAPLFSPNTADRLLQTMPSLPSGTPPAAIPPPPGSVLSPMVSGGGLSDVSINDDELYKLFQATVTDSPGPAVPPPAAALDASMPLADFFLNDDVDWEDEDGLLAMDDWAPNEEGPHTRTRHRFLSSPLQPPRAPAFIEPHRPVTRAARRSGPTNRDLRRMARTEEVRATAAAEAAAAAAAVAGVAAQQPDGAPVPNAAAVDEAAVGGLFTADQVRHRPVPRVALSAFVPPRWSACLVCQVFFAARREIGSKAAFVAVFNTAHTCC